MKKLHDRGAIVPQDSHRLTSEQKVKSLEYLMFVKKKRDGRMKGRDCVYGRNQRDDIKKKKPHPQQWRLNM